MGMFTGILGGMLQSSGIPLLSGIGSALGVKDQRDFIESQQERQMQFQQSMSSTAYQRAVSDMKAAGLNPMLAYSQGGAQGAAGAGAVAGGDVAVGASQGASSAAAVRQQAAQEELTRAETQRVRAEADLTETEAELRREYRGHGPELRDLDILSRRAELAVKDYDAFLARQMEREGVPASQIARIKEQLRQIRQEIRESQSREEVNRAEAKLKDLDVPRGMAYADFYRSEMGRRSPYTHEVEKGVATAAEAFRDFGAGMRGMGAARVNRGFNRR